MNGNKLSVTLNGTCHAPPDVVYQFLTDIPGHIHWAGEQQPGYFRLLSLDVPKREAEVGLEFESTGSIPGSRHRFQDKSRVTEMIPNKLFEFRTDSTVELSDSRAMEAEYVHRYELFPDGDGCRVKYTFRQEKVSNPMLRLALPIVRTMTWKFGMPFMMKGGFNNLLHDAERQASRNGR
jgi:hypothetical protein